MPKASLNAWLVEIHCVPHKLPLFPIRVSCSLKQSILPQDYFEIISKRLQQTKVNHGKQSPVVRDGGGNEDFWYRRMTAVGNGALRIGRSWHTPRSLACFFFPQSRRFAFCDRQWLMVPNGKPQPVRPWWVEGVLPPSEAERGRRTFFFDTGTAGGVKRAEFS
mmetsp:Transcript_4793/g.13403  ORF Transcript_4793/g.13403 Transcript_4793/m.13403 type:complete len:163 (-) Transcript_4793:2106-2594(-)